jgi:thioredoxin reductase (NADPH)
MIYDTIVIGYGPAGTTAAIYAVRAGLSVLLIGRDQGSLAKADRIENYYGFVEPISGADLLETGLAQARRLGVSVSTDEVTGVTITETFDVATARNHYEGRTLIIASGMPRKKAAVEGVADYEGRGVSYCAICDAFFYRGKIVAVIGSGDYAFHEASDLLPFASKIYILTNGRTYSGGQNEKFVVDERKLAAVTGDEDKLRAVLFTDGESLPVDGAFIAEGTANALDLAGKIGIEHDGKAIIVNADQKTSLNGLFAAGDCTGGLMQISVAVGEGAKAGMAAARYVKEQRGEKVQATQWAK